MSKRTTYEIQKKILPCVNDKPLSRAELKRKVNTGFRSVKNNCETLEEMGFLSIKVVDKHPSNGREAPEVEITTLGVKYLEKMKKK